MLTRLFPPHAGNDGYDGYRVALWLLGLLLAVKTLMSVNVMLNGYKIATTADGIPLDSYTPAGASAFVTMLAAWAVTHLTLCLTGAIVLVRYRALVPLMFTLLLLEQLGRRAVFALMPIVRNASPNLTINIIITIVIVAGLALSLMRRASVPLARDGRHAHR